MKPVELIRPAIFNSTREREIVLDCFAGSGSTMVAAEQTNRRAFCIEKDPLYCDVIRERYKTYIASVPVHEPAAPEVIDYGPGTFDE